MRAPALSRLTREALAWGLGGALVLHLLISGRSFDVGDEGFRYLLARSWARGENLFAHFQVLYPTGEYVWFGALMRALGERLAVVRLGNAILGGAAVAVFYSAVRRRVGLLPAAALGAALTLTLVPQPKILAMAAVFAVALTLFDELAPGRRWVVGVAALAGTLAAVREDSAFLALAVAVAAVARRRRPAELATCLLPGLALGFAPWMAIEWLRADALPFLAHVGYRLAFTVERLAIPTHVGWRAAQRLPRSTEEAKMAVLPLVWILPPAVYLGMLAREAVRWRGARSLHRPALAAALTGFAYLPQFLWERRDFFHFQAHLPVLLAAIAVAGSASAAGSESASPRRRLGTRLVAGGLIAVGLLGLGSAVLRRLVTPVVPYPTAAARRIGATFAGGVPPWAGLPREAGETLIVLGWGPGWYALEGLAPGTRYLSTFSRHVDTPERRRELADDLARPTNRWVVRPQSAEVPAEAQAILERLYDPRQPWRGWVLWERRATTAPTDS